jgi:hypothetical protein
MRTLVRPQSAVQEAPSKSSQRLMCRPGSAQQQESPQNGRLPLLLAKRATAGDNPLSFATSAKALIQVFIASLSAAFNSSDPEWPLKIKCQNRGAFFHSKICPLKYHARHKDFNWQIKIPVLRCVDGGPGFVFLRYCLLLGLFDDRLEERRGEEAGELAVRGGVVHGQSTCVGVDGGLIERRLLER